jgi:hypothetical protein
VRRIAALAASCRAGRQAAKWLLVGFSKKIFITFGESKNFTFAQISILTNQ